ncbi:MAG: hypothetical protein Q4G43_07625 [Mobilicoccus sp.]|nr:hypothetical protein [Mobilicoccus sp.]
MIELVAVAVVVAAMAVWMLARSVSRPGPSRTVSRPRPAAPPAPVSGSARLAAPGSRSTTPGSRTRLFGLGSPEGGGYDIPGPYAVIGYATTGFSPVRDTLVGLAVLHLDATGAVEGSWATPIDPQGADLPLHLPADDLTTAPTFAQIAPHLLSALQGRVVVAHHAEFLEAFLDTAFMASGTLVPTLPTVCTFATGRSLFPTRNHRLATLARHVESTAVVGRSPLDDAYATAALLRGLLGSRRRLTYPCAPTESTGEVILPAAAAPAPVATAAAPWLTGVVDRASGLAREFGDPRVARFVDRVVPLLLSGRVVTDEVRDLTGRLATAGYGASDLRDVQQRLLESLRRAAYEQGRISRAQLLHLRATAASIGIPTYFDDLVPPPRPQAPEPGSGSFSRPVRKPIAPPPAAHLPRCGHCMQVGHYTSQCPRREIGPVRAIGPI